MLVVDSSRAEGRRAPTPPIMYERDLSVVCAYFVREVSAGEWESVPLESTADARWERHIRPSSRSKPEIAQTSSINQTSISLPTLDESGSPTGGRFDAQTPFLDADEEPEDSADDDGIEVVASPVSRGLLSTGVSVSVVLKVIILGDASVGKTALIQRFVNGTYQALPYKPTVGADFYSQKLELIDKNRGNTKTLVTLQIWDTAGQERYRSLASSFYRGSDVCILVYDACRSETLSSLELWKRDFLRHAAPIDPDNFPFIILRNKDDALLVEGARNAGDLFQGIPSRFGVSKRNVLSVSAKQGSNVKRAFHSAAKVGLARSLQQKKNPPVSADIVRLGDWERRENIGGSSSSASNSNSCAQQC